MSLRPKKSKKKKRKGSMFYDTPADEELAEIISIRNPREARESVKEVKRLHEQTGSHDRMIHLERALLLSANRARAFLKSPALSPKEQKEMRAVSKIYRRAYDELSAKRRKYETERLRGKLYS